jgi:formylglycine-generating enzyme required for sulfatase activity
MTWAAFLEEATFLLAAAPLSARDGTEVVHELSDALRRVVCSNPALERDGLRAAQAPREASVVTHITPAPGGLWEIGAHFHWGYARALFALGPLQAKREAIAPNVGETQWAKTFDAFEDARQSFASGGYHDALTELEELGEVEEWRVHFLLGLLRLGFAGGLHAIIDLAKAEAAFRTAARYAQAHDKTVAIQALTGAAFCALKLDAPTRALGYADAGARLGKPLPELEFLAAQAALKRDDLEGGVQRLIHTISLNRGYALRLGELEAMVEDGDHWLETVQTLAIELWESLKPDVAATLANAPGIASIEGNSPSAIAGRRLGAFMTHGSKMPLYDMLQTHGQRAQLLAVALEGADESRELVSVYCAGPDVSRTEIKRTERQVREQIVKREKTLFRKEEVEWVTKTQHRSETVSVKRSSRLRHLEVRDGAGQVLGHHSMIRVPSGEFTMGSPPDAPLRSEDELRHQVTLTQAFYVGQTVVTQQLWVAINSHNPSFFQGDKLPVEQVSFFDAAKFCNALSTLEGLQPVYEIDDTEVTWSVRKGGGYRMLTETEWEYVCRADSQTTYWCGEDLTKVHATFGRNQGARTTDWDQFKPNPWGLYDVHGNVWEWCFDGYDRYGTGAVMDPVNVGDTEARVARGGSWASEKSECRSATRTSYSPWHNHNNIGFRIAIDATDEEP